MRKSINNLYFISHCEIKTHLQSPSVPPGRLGIWKDLPPCG